MRLSNLLWPIIFIVLLAMPVVLSDTCIQKEQVWNAETQQTEHFWKIEGHWYKVKEGPNGGMEIIGLATRYE